MIELKDISKAFVESTWQTLIPVVRPHWVQVLRGISLTVNKGEIVGLLGPNGAGKTTLIKILATLVLPDSGSGIVNRFDLFTQPDQVRKVIGLVNTSERSFYWRLTGRQNLLFFAALWGITGSEANTRVDKILYFLDLSDKANTSFMKYSTGQQQRLALARALIPDPPVLLMDEPTRSLDPVAASELRRFVKTDLSEQMNKTVVWCTHNLKEAEEICDRLFFIHKGKIIASGSMTEMRRLLGRDDTVYIQADRLPEKTLMENFNIDQIEILSKKKNGYGYMEGVLRVAPDRIPDLLRELVSQGISIYGCIPRQASLETIFDKILGHQEMGNET
jgi:ABC-2 type transport system ATP-binding protein